MTNKNMLIKGYTSTMKWIKNNVNCTTFSLSWIQIDNDSVIVKVETVTEIDMNTQIISCYQVTVDSKGYCTILHIQAVFMVGHVIIT